MNDLTVFVIEELKAQGADLVGVGSLAELPPETRGGFLLGICIALKYPRDVIRGIAHLPTAEYREWYCALNERLDALVECGADLLRSRGYGALAQTRQRVGFGEKENDTLLPHKTVATRAGIGWIGKSALLVTEQFGSMVRLSSVLTNAPLSVADPMNSSMCGACRVCMDACPAGAIHGRLWTRGTQRDELLNPSVCRKAAQARSKQGFGGTETICGKCIVVCPYTRRYLDSEDERG